MRSLGIVDEGGLSEQFLIDAEMGSGLETTRIKAVIRSYIKGADNIGNLRVESFHWEMPPTSPDDTPERRLLR
ncbi:hypothetical protein CFRS1_v009669 [Colletotrichum fructicola]|nr:hypothetical protein CFRS1_v009669 [Colletotrichum fructicola]